MISKSKIRLTATVAALAVSASVLSAHAGTLRFELGGDGSNGIIGQGTVSSPRTGEVPYGTEWQGTETDVDGSVTLRVAPHAFTSGANGVAGTYTVGTTAVTGVYLGANPTDPTALVVQSANGLGVMNNGTLLTDDSPREVDGSSGGSFGTGWFDFLALDFSRGVALDYVQFSEWDAGDRFRLIYDANGDGVIGNEGDFLSDAFGENVTNGRFDAFAGLNAGSLGIAAVNASSAWRFQEVGVSWTSPDGPTGPTDPTGPTAGPGTPPIAPVPLPAAGWMLLAAIGGVAGLRRLAKRA